MRMRIRSKLAKTVLLSALFLSGQGYGNPLPNGLYKEFVRLRATIYCYMEQGMARDFISDYTRQYYSLMPSGDLQRINSAMSSSVASEIERSVRRDIDLLINEWGGCSGIAQEARDFINSQTEKELPLRGKKEEEAFEF